MEYLKDISFSILLSFPIAYILYSLIVLFLTIGQQVNEGFIIFGYIGFLAIPFLSIILLPFIYRFVQTGGSIKYVVIVLAVIGWTIFLYRILPLLYLFDYKADLY